MQEFMNPAAEGYINKDIITLTHFIAIETKYEVPIFVLTIQTISKSENKNLIVKSKQFESGC